MPGGAPGLLGGQQAMGSQGRQERAGVPNRRERGSRGNIAHMGCVPRPPRCWAALLTETTDKDRPS